MTFRNSAVINGHSEGRATLPESGHRTELQSMAAVRERINRIPRTRFYGSKRRLLAWLLDVLWPLDFATVLDAFGGTSCVSSLFMQMGKAVTFHDGLLCNQVSARALLMDRPVDQVDLNLHLRKIKPVTGFIAKSFKGKYFTHAENRWLDGVARYISQLDNCVDRDVLLHCVFQACLQKRPFNAFHRANLNVRLNDVERTFGNATTWAKSFATHMRTTYAELMAAPRDMGSVSFLQPMDVCAIPAEYDLVYIDPPYLRSDRSPERYVRMYHFLEGLARYSDWQRLIDPDSSLGSLPDNYYARDWESRVTFLDHLTMVLQAHSHAIVVLSYVRGGYPSEAKLRELFTETFAETLVYEQELPHALSRRTTAEVVLIGIPE